MSKTVPSVLALTLVGSFCFIKTAEQAKIQSSAADSLITLPYLPSKHKDAARALRLGYLDEENPYLNMGPISTKKANELFFQSRSQICEWLAALHRSISRLEIHNEGQASQNDNQATLNKSSTQHALLRNKLDGLIDLITRLQDPAIQDEDSEIKSAINTCFTIMKDFITQQFDKDPTKAPKLDRQQLRVMEPFHAASHKGATMRADQVSAILRTIRYTTSNQQTSQT